MQLDEIVAKRVEVSAYLDALAKREDAIIENYRKVLQDRDRTREAAAAVNQFTDV